MMTPLKGHFFLFENLKYMDKPSLQFKGSTLQLRIDCLSLRIDYEQLINLAKNP